MSGVPVVLYSRDLEPITVTVLPALAHSYLRENGRVMVHVMEPISWMVHRPDLPVEPARIRRVMIERHLLRMPNGSQGEILIVDDDEASLLLRAAFLPGQTRGLNEERAKAYADGFFDAISNLIGGQR
jgi:hypothetical protein